MHHKQCPHCTNVLSLDPKWRVFYCETCVSEILATATDLKEERMEKGVKIHEDPGFTVAGMLTVSPPHNTGRKDDYGKPAFELIPPHVLLEVAKALSYGAKKYGADNWKMVPGAKRRYNGAYLRHMNAIDRGETHDTESGLHHISHAIASLLFLGEFELAQIPEVPE